MNRRTAFATMTAFVLATGAGLVSPVYGVDRAATETASQVRRALQRLPYYGVFDFLAFGVEDGAIVLRGYAHRSALRREAEEMVRRATRMEVANRIEVLPSSSYDDRIRWATFQQIYTDAIADKYVPGGAMQARYELLDMIRFPGMEPYGTYPVHIIVKNRHVALVGAVDNETDKAIVLTRANHVSGTASVEDLIRIHSD
jgi:hyperosmotically inducible periplasmic protein